MADYRQTIEEIRTYLASADRAPVPGLNDLASAYASLCREANGRLRRCVDYLRRGHRSEAIHLAECQPPLLDMVGALDFPELAEWEQVCASFGLERAGRPMMEAGREVNEAYAEEQPMAELLARHRSLALSRAPLPQRLKIVRELAQRDARNPAWQEDVRALEQARLRELAAEAVSAIRNRQIEVIDQLLAELKEAGWASPIPPDLMTTLATASLTSHRQVAADELWRLAPAVRAACAAGSVTQARAVLGHWSAIVRASGFVLPADLREVIRPLNELIDSEEDRHERGRRMAELCERLRAGIRAHELPEQLKALHLAAVRLELPIPDDLENEYRRSLVGGERERRAELRRSWITAIALIVLIAAALGGLLIAIIISASKH